MENQHKYIFGTSNAARVAACSIAVSIFLTPLHAADRDETFEIGVSFASSRKVPSYTQTQSEGSDSEDTLQQSQALEGESGSAVVEQTTNSIADISHDNLHSGGTIVRIVEGVADDGVQEVQDDRVPLSISELPNPCDILSFMCCEGPLDEDEENLRTKLNEFRESTKQAVQNAFAIPKCIVEFYEKEWRKELEPHLVGDEMQIGVYTFWLRLGIELQKDPNPFINITHKTIWLLLCYKGIRSGLGNNTPEPTLNKDLLGDWLADKTTLCEAISFYIDNCMYK